MTDFVAAGGSRLPKLLVGMLGAVALIVAQASGQQVRTIEPQLTRLFGSDSMQMWNPVLSPDGRWIVFFREEAQKGNLWVVSAAGGEPVPITTGPYGDFNPVFFPSGDRIAFQSTRPARPGDPHAYVMVMPFDPRTGRGGTPRQVSLEGIYGQTLALSPDGEWIAYFAMADTLKRLMAVPSTGGTARTLAEFGNSVMLIQNPEWSGDGRFVYFGLRRRGTETRSVMRAPLTQGPAEQLGTAGALVRIFPDRGLVLQQINQGQGPGQAPSYEIATLEGRTVVRFRIPRNMQLGRLTPDGRGLLASQRNVVAPIRVVPVAGGPVRQLTEAREYDWPLGWSPDGSHVYAWTRINGQEEVMRLPVNGGPAAQWPMPRETEQPATLGPDGRYLAYSLTSGSDSRTLAVRRLADGETRVVTRTALSPMAYVTGPGGSSTNGGEFLYVERRGDRLELRTTPPEGPSHLLRAFPASYAGRTGFGVHGNRIAYVEPRGDSTAVFVAQGPNGRAPRLLATVSGRAPNPVWSHDGRWLAFDHYPPGQGSRYGVLLIGIGPDGTITDPPRVLEAGPQFGWQIEWLPDDRAFTVFGMTGLGNETHVFLVSLREGERPVSITRDDPSMRWGYSLSPDGRYVAYPAEIPRGSSLWRVDLGDVLVGGGNPRR